MHRSRKGLTSCSDVPHTDTKCILSILPSPPALQLWHNLSVQHEALWVAPTQPQYRSQKPHLQFPTRHCLQTQFNRVLVLLLDQDEHTPGCSQKAEGGTCCFGAQSSHITGSQGCWTTGTKRSRGCVGTVFQGGGQERSWEGTSGSSVPLKDAATVEHPSSGPLSQIERCSALPG